jgi:hypothetical protein
MVKTHWRLHLLEDRDLKGHFACFKEIYAVITMQSPISAPEVARRLNQRSVLRISCSPSSHNPQQALDAWQSGEKNEIR